MSRIRGRELSCRGLGEAGLARTLVRHGGAQPVRSRGVARPRTGAWRRWAATELPLRWRWHATCVEAHEGGRGAKRRRRWWQRCGRRSSRTPRCRLRSTEKNGEHQWRSLPENHVGKKKIKGNSHTMVDLQKGEYHEDDEKNLVVVVLVRDALAGQKELTGGVVGVGRR